MMIGASAGTCVDWSVGVRVVLRAAGLGIRPVAVSSVIDHSFHPSAALAVGKVRSNLALLLAAPVGMRAARAIL